MRHLSKLALCFLASVYDLRLDLTRRIIRSFIELAAAAMLDRASCDDCRQRISFYSLLSCLLRKGGLSVSRGETEVASLLSARRVGKSLLDFLRSFIDVFSDICRFVCCRVHLSSQMALRD